MKAIIFEPHPDISTNPVLVNLIQRLSEDQILIDIYMPRNDRYLPLEPNDHVKIFDYPREVKRNFFNSLLLNRQAGVMRKKYSGNNYVVLAVDPEGLVDSYRYFKKINIPIVYLSFEIFFKDEMNSDKLKRLKKREIVAHREASFTIIQDQERSRILTIENELHEHEFFYMPVAPSLNPVIQKSDYLREKYNISRDKYIVILTGDFNERSYAEELMENTQYWPDDFVLVVHLRSFPDEKTRNFIEKSKSSRIYFSIEPLNDTDYHRALASADIGLALYKSVYLSPYSGKNVKNVGLASGKFSYYMKCGLPTVSVSQRYFKDLLREFGYGIDIDDFRNLPDALIEIKNKYDEYSRECKRLFETRLNFDLYYPSLKSKLAQLM